MIQESRYGCSCCIVHQALTLSLPVPPPLLHLAIQACALLLGVGFALLHFATAANPFVLGGDWIQERFERRVDWRGREELA